MKPQLILQYLTSDKYGRITMLSEPNVQWLMKHVKKDRLLLDICDKNHDISASEINLIPHQSCSFIVQDGIKKGLESFDSLREAVVFVFSPKTGKLTPKVYLPATRKKEDYIF